MDDKKKVQPAAEQSEATVEHTEPAECWCEDMKQEMEDYIEEQGIYIRQ
ncbi:MAG: hypothetical protein ACI4KM_12930 [Oscillospiraceae bacterium]